MQSDGLKSLLDRWDLLFMRYLGFLLNHLFLKRSVQVICFFTSLICFTVRSQFVDCINSTAGRIMHREKLPCSLLLSLRVTKWWGALEAKVGVLNAALEFYFGCFFQLQNRLRSRLQHKGLSMHHFLQPSRGEWDAGRGPLQDT